MVLGKRETYLYRGGCTDWSGMVNTQSHIYRLGYCSRNSCQCTCGWRGWARMLIRGFRIYGNMIEIALFVRRLLVHGK